MTPVDRLSHPFLRGPDVADRVARLLQGISSRSSEIEADIAWATATAGDEDTARRLGTLLARWSATVGAYEQASMSLQLWASASAPGPDGPDAHVPEDTARTALAALDRLEATTLAARVPGMGPDAVAAAPLLDAAGGSAGPRIVALGPGERVVSLRAAGPYPGHVQDDVHRLAVDLVSQSRGALSLALPDDGAVPVRVTVRPTPPEHDDSGSRSGHVVEGSLVAPEGLVVLERSGTPALRVQVPIGVWRVRATVTDDGTSWDLVLWRGRSLPDAVVLRQGHPSSG